MIKTISILHLEDNPLDSELVQARLEEADLDCQVTSARSRQEFELALRKGDYDVILADYQLPAYDGTSALRFAREACPEIPFIFVSGTMGEDAAIEGLTQGATDYVLKQKLSRLAPAVRRALEDAENRKARKSAENALQESAERFRAVADSANEGIISVDGVGTIIYWNRAAEVIFGFSHEEIVGQPVYRIMPERYQKSLRDPSLWGTNGILLRVGKVIEAFGRRKDDSEIPIEISLGSWNTQAGAFYTAMVRDITERKRSEEILRLQSAALEAAANGIVITEREGTITWVNPAFTQMSGYSAEEVIGKNPRVLKSGKQDPQFYQTLWETVLSGNVWHNELVNQHKDGHLYVEEMTIAPVRQPGGEISHFVAIKQDVSERKHHELEREAIISVAAAMRSTTTRIELVEIFLNQIKELFNADGALLDTRTTVRGEITVEMGCGAIGQRFSGLRIPPGKGISRQVIDSKKPYLNNQAHTDPLFFRADLLGDSHAVACVPLIAQEQVIGALLMIRKGEISESEVGLLAAIANLAANAIHRVTLHEDLQQSNRELIQAYYATIEGWAHALDLRDKETEGHTRRVTEMTLHLARAMGVDETDLTNIQRGAILHDIGKMGIPDDILFKPGPLTREEWLVMRKHPVYAYEMLSTIHYLQSALDIPYCHHEKWDGSGYPRGLKGEQIPLAARIFAVIDVWDALRTNRRYRQAWKESDVLDYIRGQAGKHFDPQVVEAFLRIQPSLAG